MLVPVPISSPGMLIHRGFRMRPLHISAMSTRNSGMRIPVETGVHVGKETGPKMTVSHRSLSLIFLVDAKARFLRAR